MLHVNNKGKDQFLHLHGDSRIQIEFPNFIFLIFSNTFSAPLVPSFGMVGTFEKIMLWTVSKVLNHKLRW